MRCSPIAVTNSRRAGGETSFSAGGMLFRQAAPLRATDEIVTQSVKVSFVITGSYVRLRDGHSSPARSGDLPRTKVSSAWNRGTDSVPLCHPGPLRLAGRRRRNLRVAAHAPVHPAQHGVVRLRRLELQVQVV